MATTPPKLYFPLNKGIYEVAANLRPLDASTLLEFDSQWPAYRSVREAGRQENLSKYFPPSVDTSEELQNTIALFLIENLCRHHSQYFSRSTANTLLCKWSGDLLVWNEKGLYQSQHSRCNSHVPYLNLLDAVNSQLQEDLAIWRHQSQREWLGSVSLFFPNHWAAQDKVGKSFNAVHAPVAEFAALAKRSTQFSEMMVNKGPFERFAWGLSTDQQLNHHPIPAPGHEEGWQGRAFNPKDPTLFLRIERQTLCPFPELNAGLFGIRTYFRNVADLSSSERTLISQAIESMSPQARHYKGLTESASQIQKWLHPNCAP